MSASQATGLGEITDVKANEAWPKEVAFSAWLAANLDRLRDSLKLDEFEQIETEAAVGGRAGLYIDTQKGAASSKAAFDYLKQHRADLEGKIALPVEWERLDGTRACRISVARSNSNIEQVALNLPEARNWVVNQLRAFKDAFQPLLPEAAAAAEHAALQAESPPDMTDAE